MFFRLFVLAVALSQGNGSQPNLSAVIGDVRAVALEEPPLLPSQEDEGAARTKTAEILLVWAWAESRWEARALGDNGHACGVLQLHPIARPGYSCAAVRADRRLGLRLGLAWMRRMSAQCGSLEGGLRAFASGRCSGAREFVARRCALVGGCE